MVASVDALGLGSARRAISCRRWSGQVVGSPGTTLTAASLLPSMDGHPRSWPFERDQAPCETWPRASVDRVCSEEASKLGGHAVWLFDHEEVGGVRQREAFGVRER